MPPLVGCWVCFALWMGIFLLGWSSCIFPYWCVSPFYPFAGEFSRCFSQPFITILLWLRLSWLALCWIAEGILQFMWIIIGLRPIFVLLWLRPRMRLLRSKCKRGILSSQYKSGKNCVLVFKCKILLGLIWNLSIYEIGSKCVFCKLKCLCLGPNFYKCPGWADEQCGELEETKWLWTSRGCFSVRSTFSSHLYWFLNNLLNYRYIYRLNLPWKLRASEQTW